MYHLAKNKHSVFIRCADALAFTSQIAIFLFTAASNSKVTALNTKNDGKGQMTKTQANVCGVAQCIREGALLSIDYHVLIICTSFSY